jgi:hypothetical protein
MQRFYLLYILQPNLGQFIEAKAQDNCRIFAEGQPLALFQSFRSNHLYLITTIPLLLLQCKSLRAFQDWIM